MKILTLLLLFIFSLSTFAKALSPEEKTKKKQLALLKREVAKFKEKDLVAQLRSFVFETRPNRLPGGEGHDLAQKFIEQEILKVAPANPAKVHLFKPQFDLLKTHYQEEFKGKIASQFSTKTPEYKNWSKFVSHLDDVAKHFVEVKGKNIVWEKKGINKENENILIIGVNYDSIVFDTKNFLFDLKKDGVAPGADDNGTGVILALNLIKFLANNDLTTDVQIVFFDFQEFFALGAAAYVEELKTQAKLDKVYAFVNLLMLGHDSKKEDKEKKYFNYGFYLKDQTIAPSFRTFLDDLSLYGKNFSTQIKFNEIVYDIGPSDATHFYKAGVSSLVVSQNHENDLNPRQHGADDFVETLNHKTFYQSYKFLIGGLTSYLLRL